MCAPFIAVEFSCGRQSFAGPSQASQNEVGKGTRGSCGGATPAAEAQDGEAASHALPTEGALCWAQNAVNQLPGTATSLTCYGQYLGSSSGIYYLLSFHK